MSKIVIALGGNALGKNPSEQLSLLKDVAKIIVDLVKDVAVEIELNDVKKRDAILNKTGFNVTNAINFNKETTDEVEKVKPVRRVGQPEEKAATAPTGRRTATPVYKVVTPTK